MQVKRQSEPSPPQEWELFGEIPTNMLPCPLIKVGPNTAQHTCPAYFPI